MTDAIQNEELKRALVIAACDDKAHYNTTQLRKASAILMSYGFISMANNCAQQAWRRDHARSPMWKQLKWSNK